MMDYSDELMIKIDAVFSLSSSIEDGTDKVKEDGYASETFSNELNSMKSGEHVDLDVKYVTGENYSCFINGNSSNEPDSSRPSLGIDERHDEAISGKGDVCTDAITALGDIARNELDDMDIVENQILVHENEVIDKECTSDYLQDEVNQDDLNDGHEIIAEWTVESNEDSLLNERDETLVEILEDTTENEFKSNRGPHESHNNESVANSIRFSSSKETSTRISDCLITGNQYTTGRVQDNFSTLHSKDVDLHIVGINRSEQKYHETFSKITKEANISDDCKHSKETMSFVEKINGKKPSIVGTEIFQMRSLLTGKRVDVSYAADLQPDREESIYTVIKPCFIVLNRINENVHDGGVDFSTRLTSRKRKSKCSNFCRKQFLKRKFKKSCIPSTCNMTCIRKGGFVVLKYKTSKASSSFEHTCSSKENEFPRMMITERKTVENETDQVSAEAHFPPNIRSSRKRKPTSLLNDHFIIGDIMLKRKKVPTIKIESATDAEFNRDSVTDHVKCKNQVEKKSALTSCSKDIQKEANNVKKEVVVHSFGSIKAKADTTRKKAKFEIEIDNPEIPADVMISHGETNKCNERETTLDNLTGESKIHEPVTGIGHRAEDVKVLNLEGGLICGFVPSSDGTSIYVSKRKRTKTPAELIASIKFKPNTTTKLRNTDMTNYCAQFVKTILSPKVTGRQLTDEMFKPQAKLKAACFPVADADPEKDKTNLMPKNTVHVFIPESQPSESCVRVERDLQKAISTSHHTYAPTEPKHPNSSSVVKVGQENLLTDILSQTNVSFDKLSSVNISSSQHNYMFNETTSSSISTGSDNCSQSSPMLVPSRVCDKPSVSDTKSLLNGNLTNLACGLKDPKSTTVRTVPSKSTPRVLKSILSSNINERQQKVSQSTQCFIFPSEKKVKTPKKVSDTIFKVIDSKTVIKYIKSKADNEVQPEQISQSVGDIKGKIFSTNKPVAAVRPIGTCPPEKHTALVQGIITGKGSEVENVATAPNLASIPAIIESRISSVCDFSQGELVTSTTTNQLKESEMHLSSYVGVTNYLTKQPQCQQLAGISQMSGANSVGSLRPAKQFGNVIAAVSKAEGIFKGPGKRTFYLLNVDGKNVLIPLQDNIVQPRAYVVSSNLSAEKTAAKADLILNSVEPEATLSTVVAKEAKYTQSLLEKQSILITATSNSEIEKHAAECLKVAMGGLRILKPKVATDNSSVRDKACDSVETLTILNNNFKTSMESETTDQVHPYIEGSKESTGNKSDNEKSEFSELTGVRESVVPLTRESRLKQLREKLRQQEEAVEQLRKQRIASAITQS